ncbi:MAG: MBL fold metallo-hydrolase [Clostridia bacterium]
MNCKRLVCGLYESNAYLIFAKDGQSAFLIDAGDDLAGLLSAIDASGARLQAIVLTHGHFDHILAAKGIREKTGAKVYIGAGDAPYLADQLLNCYDEQVSRAAFAPMEADELIGVPGREGVITLCGYDLRVLETPGHTPGGICLYCEEEKALFTGDTLFARGYGRMDLPGGSEHDMVRSLKKLLALEDDVTIYPGHGPLATIGAARGGLF